jgi:hypothetical protein
MLAIASTIAGNALADPAEIGLTSYEHWEAALRDGQIVSVTELSDAMQGLHPDLSEGNFRAAQLYVLEALAYTDDAGNEQVYSAPGLLMGWGDANDDGEIISAWEYVLPEDPDLTNMCINLTAWPRSGMTSISFSL